MKKSDYDISNYATKRFLDSPFPNFLYHSPASFRNYVNSYSRENINVLHLIKKKAKENENENTKNLLNEFERELIEKDFEKEEGEEKEKLETPLKIGKNKFLYPKSTEKSKNHLLNNFDKNFLLFRTKKNVFKRKNDKNENFARR